MKLVIKLGETIDTLSTCIFILYHSSSFLSVFFLKKMAPSNFVANILFLIQVRGASVPCREPLSVKTFTVWIFSISKIQQVIELDETVDSVLKYLFILHNSC